MNLEDIANIAFVVRFLRDYDSANIYLVGGSVRDYFLGIKSIDFDLVIEGISQENLIQFLEKHGRVVSVEGRTFGVIKFRPQTLDQIFDIALPRRERYLAGMRRKNAEIELKNVTIYDDLARRDFTINAMALPLKQTGRGQKLNKFQITNLIDPFGGLNDLRQKIIRAVGNPEERFTEDPTRILRGIRFAIKFDFNIDPETKTAMIRFAPEILKTFINDQDTKVQRVSWEVIGQEFIKSFGIDPVRTIKLFDETGLLGLILPEVMAMKNVSQPPQFHTEGDVFVHTVLALKNLPPKASLETKLAVLLHDVGKPLTFQSAEKTGDRIRFNNHDVVGAELTRDILTRLKLPGKLIDDVVWLVGNHMKLPYSFPRMRKDKQKRFAREPLFPELLTVVQADAKASVWANGNFNLDFLPPVKKVLAEIEADKQAQKPLEIINGGEIIDIISGINPSFDPQKQGKVVGALKKKINSMYDRGEIKGKEDAFLATGRQYREILNEKEKGKENC